jgi:hypothetical protein
VKSLVFLSFLAELAAVRLSTAQNSWPTYLPMPNSGCPSFGSIARGPKKHVQVRAGLRAVAERVLRPLGRWRQGMSPRHQLRNLDGYILRDVGISQTERLFAIVFPHRVDAAVFGE